MKLCMASICKNESANIETWLQHVSKADMIYLVDTGSTDDTVRIACEYAVANEINLEVLFYPGTEMDLGAARNLAHSLIDDGDLVAWLDLDERFSDEGWVDLFKAAAETSDATALYVEMRNGDSHYNQMKAYVKGKYVWRYRAHEVLYPVDAHANLLNALVENVHTDHYPDREKPRNYIDALALDVRDNYSDSRPLFYYARELCYAITYGENLDLIKTARLEVDRLEHLPNVWDDYVALANMELSIAEYVAGFRANSEARIYKALAARPDRVETHALAASTFSYLDDPYSAMAHALRGIEASKSERPFLFEAVSSNLSLCYRTLIDVCKQTGDLQKACYYAIQDAQLLGLDTNTHIADLGIDLKEVGATIK